MNIIEKCYMVLIQLITSWKIENIGDRLVLNRTDAILHGIVGQIMIPKASLDCRQFYYWCKYYIWCNDSIIFFRYVTRIGKHHASYRASLAGVKRV